MLENSNGVTSTEQLLAEFCEKTFLKLWSYPNPYKDDGHELCDLLAVFDNNAFIFFDRKRLLSVRTDKDEVVLWDRWKRNVIDRQVRTAHGAERYIRSGRPIFLDAQCTKPFPFSFDRTEVVIHKIIVAHGAKDACEQASPQNVYGSLAINYTETDGDERSEPFQIVIDKKDPVHILDSHNLPILLQELDTVDDFSAYLNEKVRAISAYDFVCYCGEEDLLGHYLLNYNPSTNKRMIGTKESTNISGIMIGEGEWYNFLQTDLYINTKNENKVSYFWDHLIQRTCQNSLDGTLGGNSNIVEGKSAIYEMVKEPRFMRRALSEKMLSSVKNFPDIGPSSRNVTLLPSIQPNVSYVLLQLRLPESLHAAPGYREKRLELLEVACGSAKNKFSHLVKVIGIAIDAPKFTGGATSEDFILMPCETWTEEQRAHYEEMNKEYNFFSTANVRQHTDRVTEFVAPQRSYLRKGNDKVGRNAPCPCGSGKKYKKCHG